MKKRKSGQKIILWIGRLLVAAGLILLAEPYVRDFYFNIKASQCIADFENLCERDGMAKADGAAAHRQAGSTGEKDSERNRDAVYAQMQAYNRRIYEEGQSGITDRESFENLPEELKLLEREVIGYIEIPSIDVRLPLYAGATEENMADGVAVLSNTSMPVGGMNTNCVIAGHRGYKSSKYFKDIEDISAGDSVLVTNRWETLAYTVTGFDIIDPADTDAIKIQEGRELVTLMTCHPYMGNGRYRYLVLCVPAQADGEDRNDRGANKISDMSHTI